MRNNIILATDSYKLTHWRQYPGGTRTVYSYFESRPGARFPETVFFGLQAILAQNLMDYRVSQLDVLEAQALSEAHFGRDLINADGWYHILREHHGKLPVRIRAVPEGTPVPTGNVLMTVENTDPAVPWLTNAIESLLTHVWYPSTVATLSRQIKKDIDHFLRETGCDPALADMMLQDFGYRGAATHDAASIGGAAHLVNFRGSDTVPAMRFLEHYYDARLDGLAYSVPATEHSVMTARGRDGEPEVLAQVLDAYPAGIVSVVADSFDVYRFVSEYVCGAFADRILARGGTFVVRPDSVTTEHPTPEAEVLWIVRRLEERFGSTANTRGYKTLDPHVRVLWGDGIDRDGIWRILKTLAAAGYAADNMACFGMGGGLLQKVNRDTQRFAFKCSAMEDGRGWRDVRKEPLDQSKRSKAGRMQLSRFTDEHGDPSYRTLPLGTRVAIPANLRIGRHGDDRRTCAEDVLETVFEGGEIRRRQTLDDVRRRAAL